MTTSDWFLVPQWPAPANIRALTTLRGPEGDFDLRQVTYREQLKSLAGLPRDPAWLNQTHGTRAIPAYSSAEADASFSDTPGEICAVLTADCLPVLFCEEDGSRIAAIHAGWRGLAAGILQETLAKGLFHRGKTLAWLGPAIGPGHFEVGPEVRETFIDRWPGCQNAFQPSSAGRWMADIYSLAIFQLRALGVRRVYGGTHCTVAENRLFFSYRVTKEAGRMATLIWMT